MAAVNLEDHTYSDWTVMKTKGKSWKILLDCCCDENEMRLLCGYESGNFVRGCMLLRMSRRKQRYKNRKSKFVDFCHCWCCWSEVPQ